MFFGKADIFLFADHIFFERMDVWVIKIDRKFDSRGKDRFHHFARTRCTARVKQKFIMSVW